MIMKKVIDKQKQLNELLAEFDLRIDMQQKWNLLWVKEQNNSLDKLRDDFKEKIQALLS